MDEEGSFIEGGGEGKLVAESVKWGDEIPGSSFHRSFGLAVLL